MNPFDTVVLAYAMNRGSQCEALAIRAALEHFGYTVLTYPLIHKPRVEAFLARNIPETDHVIICAHGDINSEGEQIIKIPCKHKVEGEPGWPDTTIELSPATVGNYVRNGRGTLIMVACHAGREEMAKAFLSAGYDRYIAADGTPDVRSSVLFVTAFYSFIMDLGERKARMFLSEEEAAKKASQIDPETYETGTKLFRYYVR